MSKSSMGCQKVRNGEVIQIITNKSVLVLAIIIVTATSTNRTDPKKIDKTNSGHIGQRMPRSP